jgi:hypothetical protein
MVRPVGYIGADGKYHRGATDTPTAHDVSSQYKDWSHDNQRRRFHGDIVQPYVNGKPNPEFVKVYRGEVADKYFTQEQQDKADRELGGL